MLRLYSNLAYFSLRLKGPKSQRQAAKKGTVTQQIRTQDMFRDYYENTIAMYKNNFTRQQLQNSSQAVKRVFSLRNATPSQILRFRIEQAVKKYQRQFNDHGSSPVQVASMSERVIFLMMHVKKYPKDTKGGRYLARLLDQRRKMLAYLMKTDYHKYQWICTDYGIPQVHPLNAHHRKMEGIKENTFRKIF